MKPYLEPLDYNKSNVMSMPLELPFVENLKEVNEDIVSRCEFVHNLGILLSQTREGIFGIHYYNDGNNEYAEIVHKGNYRERVNIHMDSWAAIITDVMKVVGV